jgi:hypothetical protein
MRLLLGLAWAAATLAGASATAATPSIQIRGAVARAVIIPEDRSDIQVTVVKANRAFPLRVSRFGSAVFIDGDVRHRARVCRRRLGLPTVEVRGRGELAYDAMPRLVIRAPADVSISAGEAVFGAIGRGRTVDFANQGCGDWVIGNVARRLRISESGSGVVRAGSAQTADLSVAAAGRVFAREIRGGLKAFSTGAGNIDAVAVTGPLDARVAGAGDISVGAGRVTDLSASVAGSGAVNFGGVARSLHAQVAGPGVVSAAQVTGPVVRRVFGAGAVHIGPAQVGPAPPGR